MIYLNLFAASVQLFGLLLSKHLNVSWLFYWCLFWFVYCMGNSAYLMIREDK